MATPLASKSMKEFCSLLFFLLLSVGSRQVGQPSWGHQNSKNCVRSVPDTGGALRGSDAEYSQ